MAEQPVNLYSYLNSSFQPKGLVYYLRRIAGIFLHQEFPVSNVDRFFSWLYTHGASFFFRRSVVVFLSSLAVAGAVLFVRTARSSSFSILQGKGSLGINLVFLIIAGILSVFLHECGHGLAVKHFGRRVRRGGFMLYLGMPAFFIDTMDIWMANRKARLAVSWAGPFVNLVIGGLCGIILAAVPGLTLEDGLYKLAAISYLGVVFNLNPLLELDGYYLLMDWLEFPALRKQSFRYLRKPFWEKLFHREQLSTDERIYATYGILAIFCTVLMVLVSLWFWHNEIVSLFNALKEVFTTIKAVR